ncbi:thioredoxin-like isoform X2 [Heptranchias perlo]|uniref:thioredoxin-like isoform X2 n=1 Tax=Heptranchias perlo TaxID=212740 RepID=UPI003559CD35
MFSAEWCGNCRMIRPHFYNLSEQLNNIVFVEVDVDDAEPLARSSGITCMPTFHFYKRETKMGEFSGTKREKLEHLLDELQPRLGSTDSSLKTQWQRIASQDGD